MAVKTMKKNAGSGQYAVGWHELTISNAVDGIWTDKSGNEKRTIDLSFEGYPDNMHHRVFETHNRTSGEEFNIANLFRYACAGIISVLNDPTGKNPVIQYDDEAVNLVNARINVLFVKEKSTADGKEYSKVFDLVPVAQETEHITWTDDDIERLKKSVEKRHSKRNSVNGNVVGTVTADTTVTATADVDLPF